MSHSTLSNPRAGGSAASDGGDGRPAPESAADTTNGAHHSEGTDDEDNRTIAQLMTANPNSTPPPAPPRSKGRQRYIQSVLRAAEEKIRHLAGIAEADRHTEAHIDDNLDGAMEQLSVVTNLMPLFEPRLAARSRGMNCRLSLNN